MTDTKLKPAIKFREVTKLYYLHQNKPTLVESLFRLERKPRFLAIDNVSLEIAKGEKVGIIGINGSGKTTFLKLVSGISTPNFGEVKTRGKTVSLIDLSAGFHPELTGKENISLNAMLLGMSKEEVDAKYDEIVGFADIGEFLSEPMYTYSSGMQLRLAFSVAVAADPDILILDEGVGFGDENFQRKSGRKIEQFFRQKKTILMASHWMPYLHDHCQRVLWFEKGKIVADGGVELLEKYRKTCLTIRS